MRYRDRWEQWLRAHVDSLSIPDGLERADVWAVATMLASHSSPAGTNITVSIETIRRKLGIRGATVLSIANWLHEAGIVVIVAKHGRGTATRRALAIPTPGEPGERTDADPSGMEGSTRR
jgi:hypothetical protein